MRARPPSATTWPTAPNAVVTARVMQMAVVTNKCTVARAGEDAIRGAVLDLHSVISHRERPLLRPREEKGAGQRLDWILMSGRRSQSSFL